MQAEFEGEIGDLALLQLRIGTGEPGVIAFHVGVEGGHHAVIAFQVIAVVGGRIEQGTLHFLQEGHRVVVGLIPQRAVDAREQSLRFGVPDPPQIAGQLSQAVDAAREAETIRRFDME